MERITAAVSRTQLTPKLLKHLIAIGQSSLVGHASRRALWNANSIPSDGDGALYFRLQNRPQLFADGLRHGNWDRNESTVAQQATESAIRSMEDDTGGEIHLEDE